MANWKWPSVKDKLEAIGYLAVPGVINAIEATVPKGKAEQFREEYKYRYSDEYPYEADKYGKQFRIYLNDTEGCPDFLRKYIDGTYGNRINNTQFIDELVKEYGFKLKKGAQDSKRIRDLVAKKFERSEFDYFDKGFYSYRNFVQDIERLVKTEKKLPCPNVLKYKEKTISRKTERKVDSGDDKSSGFTPNQMLRLGWVGEEYIFYLLRIKDETTLNALGISLDANYEVHWFNQGFQNAGEEVVFSDIKNYVLDYEIVKRWTDKSVGKGCDILVTLENGKFIFIEVKTSKRSYPYFNMTSVEMQEMEKQRNHYVLIRINNIERLLRGKSPEIIVISDPYEKLFHPRQMKEATFVIGREIK